MRNLLFASGLSDATLVGQLGGGFIELAVLFLILAVVAGVAGAQGIAGLSMTVAKWFVIIFIVLAVASLLL